MTAESVVEVGLRAGTGATAKAAPAAVPRSLARTVQALRDGSPANCFGRVVYLRVLANSLAVEAGTELKLLTKASAPVAKQPLAISVIQLATRAKLT